MHAAKSRLSSPAGMPSSSGGGNIPTRVNPICELRRVMRSSTLERAGEVEAVAEAVRAAGADS